MTSPERLSTFLESSRNIPTDKETYNDGALKNTVDRAMWFLNDRNTRELKKTLDTLKVPEFWNRSIKDIIMAIKPIDKKTNAQKIVGFMLTDVILSGSVYIHNGSNLAKIIQLYLVAEGFSVQYKDHTTVTPNIDGQLERFTLQAITQFQTGTKLHDSLQDIKSKIDTSPIKDLFSSLAFDVQKELEWTWQENTELRKKRGFGIEVIGPHEVRFSSFWSKSLLDTQTWKLRFLGTGGSLEYPFSVELVKDTSGKLLLNSSENKEKIKSALRLMNLVHYIAAMLLDMKSKDSKMSVPRFYNISSFDGIRLNANSKHIISAELLQQIILVGKENMNTQRALLVDFLNTLSQITFDSVKDFSETKMGPPN
jgi:hypothetical protein